MYKVAFRNNPATVLTAKPSEVIYTYWYELPTDNDVSSFLTQLKVDPKYITWSCEWVGNV